MKRFAPILFILMLPVRVFAEDVAVVSGEHDGFTRLAFAISPDREWRLDHGDRSATLVVPSQNLKFKDEEVFTRISKNRLGSVRSEQGEGVAEYKMMLNCDCEVRAFAYLDAYIVVDLADPPATSVKPPPARHRAPTLGAASLPDHYDNPPEIVIWNPPRAPNYIVTPHRANFPAQSGLTPTQRPDASPSISQTEETGVVSETVLGVGQEHQAAVDAARSILLQQLTLAIDQGLLEVSGPTPEGLKVDETAIVAEPEVLNEVFDGLERENQVLVQSVSLRDAIAAHGGGDPQDNRCPSPEDLDVASWGSGEDFFDELTSARKGLLSEFDKPNFDQVEHLIHIYLRYGFGAEAKSYLLEAGQNIEQQPLLLDVAAIVDGQTVQVGGPLSQAMECGGVAGLWALVGAYPDVDSKTDDELSIIEVFAELPPDIRRLVGPRLASAFLDRGLGPAARQVSDVLERAPGDHGTDHELVIGNLMQIEGSTPEASQMYRALVEDNSGAATDALIELAMLGLSQGFPPPPHLLMDLEASAKVWRGTQKGGELRRLEALWLVKQQREGDAIDMLVEEINRDSENAGLLRETAEEVLSALSVSKNLSDNYAQVVSTYKELIPMTGAGDKLRLEIGAKLLLVGLPDYAIEILQPMLQSDELGAILMAANANIKAFRPDAALLLLNGVRGDAARKLRVEAYLGLGDFEQTLNQLNQFTDMSEATVMPYWFNGNWTEAAKSNSFAAEIRRRFLPDGIGAPQRLDDPLLEKPFSLSALQEFLADSRLRTAEMKNVLLQQ